MAGTAAIGAVTHRQGAVVEEGRSPSSASGVLTDPSYRPPVARLPGLTSGAG